MNPVFKNINIFSPPQKGQFFLGEISKNWTFYKNFWIFSKPYFKILHFYDTL